MTAASRLAATVLAGSICMATAAPAQEASTELPSEDRWRFAVAPYLWMISLDGNAKVAGIKTDVDVPFKDSIKDLSFGGMLLATARKGRFGFAMNGVFTRVSPDDSVGGVDIDATSDLAQLFAGPFYRVVDWQYGATADGQPLRFALEPYVGARLNYLRVELDVRGGRQVDEDETWVDPVVGTRFGVDLTERWLLAGAADVGGVVTGSDLSPGTCRATSPTGPRCSAAIPSCRSAIGRSIQITTTTISSGMSRSTGRSSAPRSSFDLSATLSLSSPPFSREESR